MLSILEFKKKNYYKIDSVDLDILISLIINKPREFILTHPEYQLNKLEENKLKKLIKKRIAGEPIAYLIKEKEFYGLKFFVNKNVLVPRPETELITDEVLKIIRPKTKTIIIDVGTGSGCIIISIARTIKSKYKNLNNFNFFAIDISNKALKVAAKNSGLHKLKNEIVFLRGDLLKPMKNIIKFNNIKTIITANLPYLTPKQIKKSFSIQAEPRLALDGGRDGLKYYRQLFEQVKKAHLNNLYILIEIDPSQTQKIKKIIPNFFPQAKFKIIKDLAGFNRIVVVTLKQE